MILLGILCAITGCEKSPAPAPPPGEPDRPQHLATATIRIGDVPLVVEVARTEAERRKGMMFRRRLAPDEAMLFVFPHAANLAFWMKNTPVDLDLAYIRADGTILQTESMKAYSAAPAYSREPARWALEVPAGWLKAHGAGVGTKVSVPSAVSASPP